MKIICFSSNLILYESQIDKKGTIGPAILVMTWHQTGVKLLSWDFRCNLDVAEI